MSHYQPTEALRKQGRPLTYEEKWMVYHVFRAVEQNQLIKPVKQNKDIYSVASSYTGVSRTTVANIVKSVKESGKVPKLKLPGNRSQATSVPVSTEGRIREFVFEKHRDGAICHAKHIIKLLKSEFDIEINTRTMQRHLIRMGFCWSRTKKNNRSLRESDRIRQQRHNYLYELRENRKLALKMQQQLIYVDESFLHHHHGSQFSWFEEGDFIEGPTGKGRRWCFIHAMMENGLLDNTFLIFEGKKSKGDYHQQFNHEVFQKWFQEQLLVNIPENCLIIMDQCPFHMVGKEPITPSAMKKVELRKWLTEQGFSWEEKWLRPRLEEEVNRKRDKKTMVEIFAEEKGHRVIFLPVRHPELNPIELVWNIAKSHCGELFTNETSFKDQRIHLEEAFKDKINAGYCKKTFEHVKEIEERYWEVDLIFDDELGNETEDLGAIN